MCERNETDPTASWSPEQVEAFRAAARDVGAEIGKLFWAAREQIEDAWQSVLDGMSPEQKAAFEAWVEGLGDA